MILFKTNTKVRKLKIIKKKPHNTNPIIIIKIDSLFFEKSSFPNIRLVIKIPTKRPKKAPREIPIVNPKLPMNNDKQIPQIMLAINEINSIKKARFEYP
jgi:hypothetical protein